MLFILSLIQSADLNPLESTLSMCAHTYVHILSYNFPSDVTYIFWYHSIFNDLRI